MKVKQIIVDEYPEDGCPKCPFAYCGHCKVLPDEPDTHYSGNYRRHDCPIKLYKHTMEAHFRAYAESKGENVTGSEIAAAMAKTL